MNKRLREIWQSRSPRDRMILTILAILIAITLYATFVIAANRARPQLLGSVLALRADAARLEALAVEVERLRTLRPPPASQTDLRSLVQAQVSASGLANALVRIEAPDPDRVQVVFGAVAFADWLNWTIALSGQNIRLESSRVEALSKPGLVSVSAGFVRPGRR